MCGIAGTFNLSDVAPTTEQTMRRMLALLRHRGPDQFGVYLDEAVTLGSARLSILDLENGQQPLANEDGSLWIVFNGEIFNDAELRADLLARGHEFRTRSDTEVLLHLFEELGPDCLHRLNGDFAFALWDRRRQELFMARDRVGVRPLFYTVAAGQLIFASEIKALLAHPAVNAAIDSTALNQVFTYWSTVSPRTVFQNIVELPAGHFMVARPGSMAVRRYWELGFPAEHDGRNEAELAGCLRELLDDATARRFRSDVPVGAYLSGGLDSSAIVALARKRVPNLKTFSISFSDAAYDEARFQRYVADFCGTDHSVLHVTPADVARAFADVVWHAETPLLRTAPAPMFLLSQQVRESGCKVVLVGEGADEFLGGYDIFKEAKIRAFWARQPQSTWRPRLLRRLYPEIRGFDRVTDASLAAFFGQELTGLDDVHYSHSTRWRNTGRTRRFLEEAVRIDVSAAHTVAVPKAFKSWDTLEQAQYLECSIFLPEYLLSSQGDRMAMAHGVEGRFPYLDPQVVDFANRLPPRLKMRGLREKYLLRKAVGDALPRSIATRRKRPYRAPIHRSFLGTQAPEYVTELLSESALRSTGFFKPAAVRQLINKIRSGMAIGETDEMALVGILSTQLVHFHFIKHRPAAPPLGAPDNVKVCRGDQVAEEIA